LSADRAGYLFFVAALAVNCKGDLNTAFALNGDGFGYAMLNRNTHIFDQFVSGHGSGLS
jgi:hypothetical protein